jgi:hypothetical protein
MSDERVTWFKGKLRPGPRQAIGVLEMRGDVPRVVLAERAEVEGRCHVLLARAAWGPKVSLDTRGWSLVLGRDHKAHTVRNGSCGDALTTADIPRIICALEALGLATEHTLIAVDDGSSVMPWRKEG